MRLLWKCLAVTGVVVAAGGLVRALRPPADLHRPPLEVAEPPERTLLLSDLRRGTSGCVCELVLTNPSTTPTTVTVVGTDCSCAGVVHDGVRLDSSAGVSVPAGGAARLELHTRLSPEPQERVVSARLAAAGGSYPVRQPIRVLADLTAEPQSVICRYNHISGAFATPTQLLTVHTVRRTADVSTEGPPPVLQQLPDEVRVASVAAAGRPQRLADTDPVRQSWAVALALEPRPNRDYLDTTAVALITSGAVDPSCSQQRLPVHFQTTQPVRCPTAADFGTVTVGRTASRRILVRCGQGVALRSAAVGSPFGVVAKLDNEAVTHAVELTFTASTPGSWSATLQLGTSHPEAAAIEIRLTGAARE